MKFFESEIISLPFECSYCSNVYKNNGGLFSHYKKAHSGLMHFRIIPTGRPKKMTLQEKEDIFEIFDLCQFVSGDKALHQKWLKVALKFVQVHQYILETQQLEQVRKEAHKLSRIYSYIKEQSQLEYINNNYISAFIKICFQKDPILKTDSRVYQPLLYKMQNYNLSQIAIKTQTKYPKCEIDFQDQDTQQTQIFNPDYKIFNLSYNTDE
ncbi:hypothetical protein ABPG74_016433 [Tetrahymena malaccensis]